MKVLRTIGIVLMLVVFPAISWYYLDRGLDYRKKSYQRLLPKTAWDSNQFQAIQDEVDLTGKTTVYLTDRIEDDFIRKFYDQYDDAYTFQLITADPSLLEGENVFKGNLSALITPSAILIDTAMQIRNVYSHDIESLTQLIEDTAMVMPRKPAIDIILQQ